MVRATVAVLAPLVALTMSARPVRAQQQVVDDLDPAGGDVPRPEPPPPREEQPVRPADITPTLPLASAAGWILAPEPGPSTRQEQGEEALERYFDDQLGQDRLAVVGADGWYGLVARAMRRRFRPDMPAVERRRRARMNAAGVVVDELHRYSQGPSAPQDAPGTPPPEMSSQFDAAEQAALEVAEWQNFLNAPVTWYRVEVRVTYNPEGQLSAAWVTRSSGYPSLDDDALRAVRDAATAVPLPPERITAQRDAIQADWLFEAGDVATAWNQAGCVDDPVAGGLQCAALGRGIVRTRIGLLRIVDATRDTFEERRAARRRNPRRPRP